MFGDNLPVVMNASIPSSTFKKRHMAIAYHYYRESVAAGIVSVEHIDTKDNLANLLTKAVTSNDARIIEEMLFYSGD